MEVVATKAFPSQLTKSHLMEEANLMVGLHPMVEVHRASKSNLKANGEPKRNKNLIHLRKRITCSDQ